MPSETSNIELKSVTADGFSIFDNIDVRPLASFLASFTSFARCTKESANQSIPKLHANSKSILSFLDRAVVGIIVCGTFIPFLSEILPPISTIHFI